MPNVFDNIVTPFLENDANDGLKDALKLALRSDRLVVNLHHAPSKDPRIRCSIELAE